jgi:non-heme chloroperoxidase
MESKHVHTSDGVSLHYLEAGSGPTLLMIHGWSQSAIQWKHQIAELSKHYRVIALDQRGHGDSQKPKHGLKIHRLAKDVHDVLNALELNDVTLLGHSMGCSVIWAYWELFGNDHLKQLILADEPPFLTFDPTWSATVLEQAGAIFPPQGVLDTCNALAGPDGEATTRGFIGNMVTANIAAEDKEFILERNFKMSRQDAATLFYNHCAQDWRDQIPRINIPTLVIGGRVSLVPWKSMEWTAEQIPGAKLELFEEAEGGQHFMFIENPGKFNQIVREFMG